MTDERRKEILNKDLISTHEIMELMDISLSSAKKVADCIRAKYKRAFTIRGKVYTADYLSYMGR